MAFDRDTALRKAEKLLRQGRLDAAIAEYLQVIEDQPRDWNTANILGDLYVRAGQLDKAVAQYMGIADHLSEEGFFPKASALYKKILKIKGDEEHALLQLAEIAVKQGLLADAKSALGAVAERRKARGDRRGAGEIRMRLGTLDPADLEARLIGARAAAEIGETPAAVTALKELAEELAQRGRHDDALKLLSEAAGFSPGDPDISSRLMRAYIAKGDLALARQYATTPTQFKEIAADLQERGEEALALEALSEAAALDPGDIETRVRLARTYLSRRDTERARQYLTPEVAAEDTALQWALAELELRAGNADAAFTILQNILTAEPGQCDQLVLLGCSVADISVDAAYRVIDLAASTAIANDEWGAAAAALNEFVSRRPGYIPALMRLVEICVDGGLEATMYSAQGQLADAYLSAGRGAEARVIAEDLVAREPWDRSNLERFRRALTQLGEVDVDAIIAERLSGQMPFVSTDLFPAFEEDRVPDGQTPTPDAPTAAPGPPPPVQAPPAAVDATPAAIEAARPKGPPKSAPKASAPKPSAPTPDEEVFDLGGGTDVTFLEETSASPEGAPDSQESFEVDLSNVLEEMKPSMADQKPGMHKEPANDLDGVFKDLRDEVSRENITDTAAQHYKLAVAYQDMGMLDDAVTALEVAVRAPRFRFEAALMLAHIYLQRGAPEPAIEWFERAAEAPAPSSDAGRALLYELADTLEAQGETARALAVFLELQSDAGEYRDLPARLERLTKVQLRG